MKTLLMSTKDLTKQEKDTLVKYPKIRIIDTDFEGLDESQPVIYKLPEGVFYGNVLPDRLIDVIVNGADDLKLQTARLFDVAMMTYKSEPKYRNHVIAFYREMEDLDPFDAKHIKKQIKKYVTDHQIDKTDLIYAMKMALINTIKGPELPDLLDGLGWKETETRLREYMRHHKHRI